MMPMREMARETAHVPSWLMARPIAHRGLHDETAARVENSLSAARAAIAQNYAIECDIQLSSDGEVIVFHDVVLDRLTLAKGRLDQWSRADLSKVAFRHGSETIPALVELLAVVAGKVPLIVELKSLFNGDTRLADAALACVASYTGPFAFKSFDPDLLRRLRACNASQPLGLVAEAVYAPDEWPELTPERRAGLLAWEFFPDIRPDFLSWHVNDLPHAVPRLCRDGLGMPVMSWTVRTKAQKDLAARYADQIVFEEAAAR